MTTILALMAILVGNVGEDVHYSAAVVGIARDKQTYALRVVQWEDTPEVCKYPMTDGVRPTSVELALCKVWHGCERRWVIYEETWPERQLPCTQHEEAAKSLALAKSAFMEAGLDMKKTKAPLRAVANKLVIPHEAVRQLGLSQGVTLSWSWRATPGNSDAYGEWSLSASSGAVVIKRFPISYGRGAGPSYAFVAPVIIPEFRLVAFHVLDPFGGSPNRLMEIVEVSLEDIAASLKKK